MASRRAQFLDLFFIIYINDLPNVSSLTQSLLFADDTSIFCSHKDANHLVSIVNNELAKLVIWLKVNKLSLNLSKTNFMIFHPRRKKVNVNVPLTLENTVIKQVTETKFLGVLIDQHLSWKPHIDFVLKKKFEKCGNYRESPLWTNNGRIYLRENNDSPILYIKSKDDIEKVKGSIHAR